nr:hypothetical protein [Actinomycetales bacterium]
MAPKNGDTIIASRITVSGINNDRDVKEALQDLYDVFADAGLGQATFEVRGDGTADLFVKHLESVVVDRAIIEGALARGGDFRVVDGPHRIV